MALLISRTAACLPRVAGLRRCYTADLTPAEAQAKIEKFFLCETAWSDPWTPCLSSPPPPPSALPTEWSEVGHRIIDQGLRMYMDRKRFDECMRVRERIESCLREALGENMLSVYTFGSCMSGLCSNSSDLDLVIIRNIDGGSAKDPVNREEQAMHLEDYKQILLKHDFTDLKIINARVPILRREGKHGVNFDLGLFFHGVRNSVLLREYVRSCPFFQPMSLVLREWARSVGICNSWGGYFTPYCINVMIIKYLVQEVSNHFHIKVPPLLPPSSYPTAPSCYLPLSREMQRRSRAFAYDLGQHVAGFLRFYACFPWNEKVVSVVDPIADNRSESALWPKEDVDVIIEEMYAQQDPTLPIPNMGQKVDAIRLLSVRERMLYGYLHLARNKYLPANPEDSESDEWRYVPKHNTHLEGFQKL
eukprot:Sspe_Gene.75944::Locus_47445_Transcript_1_1_Confidence_1.000_Length_1340::g.75944::m.75944/K14079/PAPD4, GLD2; poly(A) RNA polymerase GLD2